MPRKILSTFLVLAALNLILAGGWLFLYQQMQKTKGALTSLKEEIAAAELKQKNIKALDKLLDDIDTDRKKITGAFVDERQVIRFIEDLEGLADLNQVNLTIKTASLPTRAEEGGPTFRFSVEGNFGSVFIFFAMLEKINYQITFEEVWFAKETKKQWIGEFNMKLLSYKL